VEGSPLYICQDCMGEGIVCPDPIRYPKVFTICNCIKESSDDAGTTTREVQEISNPRG
jgi:predicted aldo/keto reductase-like oxidoreductase